MSTLCLLNALVTSMVFCDDDLWALSRIQIHAGKTQIWNRGVVPPGHDALLRAAAAQIVDPHERSCHRAWHQGSREHHWVTGPTLRPQLPRTADDNHQLLNRIPLIRDLQSVWLMLLFCASTRANYFLRVVHPSASESFAQHHDTSMWQCFSSLLGQLPHRPTWEVRSLPLRIGQKWIGQNCFWPKLAKLGWPKRDWPKSVSSEPTHAFQLCCLFSEFLETPIKESALLQWPRRECVGESSGWAQPMKPRNRKEHNAQLNAIPM